MRPRRLAGRHLYDRAPDGPDVCSPAHACLVYDFWRHPVRRPLDALLHPAVCKDQNITMIIIKLIIIYIKLPIF